MSDTVYVVSWSIIQESADGLRAVCSLNKAGSKNKEYTHRLYRHTHIHRYTRTRYLVAACRPRDGTGRELTIP